MHLSIPFAAPSSDAGRAALTALRLPQLDRLLARLRVQSRDEGDELSLSPPHERARARALGLAGGDGQLPWASWHAAQAGLDVGDVAWGELTPVHLHLGTEQVSMIDPAALALDDAGSRALFDAALPLFTSEGWAMHWLSPSSWLVAHETLTELPTASLDRVIGRNIDRWMPDGPRARLLRRLQNEVQMLWYWHPHNDARQAAGLPAINSVWLSGCGVAQAVRPEPGWAEDVRLRAPALAEDWAAWAEAWAAVDAGPVAQAAAALDAGQAVTLTLCGERHAVSLVAAGSGWWERLSGRWRGTRAVDLLETL